MPARRAMYVLLALISAKSSGYCLFTFVCLSLRLSVCVRTHLNGRNHVLFAEKCIRLVREKLRIFPYGQYIVGIMFHWLSEDIVRFKIEVGVEEKGTKM